MSSELIKVAITAIGAVAVAGGFVYIGWRYRQKIREEVSQWLQQKNLEKTVLMSALVIFDNVTSSLERVRRRIIVETSEIGQQIISEEIVAMDSLPKELRALLEANDSCEQDIYELVS